MISLKNIFMIVLVWLIVFPKFVLSQNTFSINPNGISRLYWPFPNSQYQNPTTGTNGWYVTCSAGCIAPWNTVGHLGGDYYADDWNLSGTLDCGVSFLSPLKGTVIFAGGDPTSGYGYNIIVRSSDDSNFAFRIAHLNSISVSNGQDILAGQKLGEIGNTGLSQGCHAHCVLYKNITNIYSDSQTALQRLQQGLTLSVSGNANQFAAMYYFSAQNTIQNGLAKVSQGVSISPNPINIGNNFQSTFTLQETLGASITYASIVCAIVQGGSHVVDMEVKNNVTIPANGSYQYSSTQQWRLTDPAGTYQAVARWKDSNGNWFDFTTTSNGLNSVAFQVQQPSQKYSISGKVIDINNNGIGSVTMTLTGTSSVVVQTDNNGNYSFTNLSSNGNYEVTPSKNGYKFNPVSWKIVGLNQNWTTINFTGTQTNSQLRAITISGQGQLSNSGMHYSIIIDVDPVDNNGNGNGQTGFIRYYYDGSTVNLTAPTNIFTDQPFVRWLKNGAVYSTDRSISIVVNGDAEYTAVYGYSVSVSSNPSNGGSVTGEGSYLAGSNVTVNAVANPEYTFINWTESGSIVSENSSYPFIINLNRVLVANFSTGKGIPSPPLLISPSNNQINVVCDPVVVFEWNSVVGASSYTFQISEYQDFRTLYVSFPNPSYRVNFGGLEYGETYYWRINAKNNIGTSDWSQIWKFTTVNVVSVNEHELPLDFRLIQNYPNPFNPSTKINFSIPNSQFVTLKVYDILGRELATLVNEEKLPGTYEVKFDGSTLPSGIYFYRLQAGNPSLGSGQGYSETKKLLLLK
ncbi:hypothetical protein C0389_08165 [bacterium]|nr:hypothetical protein [bacterium]